MSIKMETDRARTALKNRAETYALYLQGKTSKEIAELLGIHQTTVSDRIGKYARYLKHTKNANRCRECDKTLAHELPVAICQDCYCDFHELQRQLAVAEQVISAFVYPSAPMTPAQREAWAEWERLHG